MLGKGKVQTARGKAQVTGARATEHAKKQEYYPYETKTKLPPTSNDLQYQEYSKDSIKHANTLDEQTLKKEAIKFSLKQKQKNDFQGEVFQKMTTKSKTDRKYWWKCVTLCV